MSRPAVLSLGVLTCSTLLSACGPRESDVPSVEVRAAIAAVIHAQNDTMSLTDPRSGTPVRLAFDYVHEGVERTPGGRYLACVDFRAEDGEVYDVDYYVRRDGEGYRVADVVVHKAGGEKVLPATERARLDSKK